MKQNQFSELQVSLSKWREDRHLSTESQRASLIPNVLEELTELSRAQTDDDRIDAICDICVFYLNTLDSVDPNRKEYFLFDYVSREVFEPENIGYFVKELMTMLLDKDINPYEVVNLLEVCANSLGYDLFEAMKETLYEISSRKGFYNPDIKKFVKEAGAYSYDECKAKYPNAIKIIENSDSFDIYESEGSNPKILTKWYKANYNNCRL